MEPVKYRAFDGRDGVLIEGENLKAFVAGREVESKPLPQKIKRSSATVEDLLQDYHVPMVLTESEFCHTTPGSLRVEMDVKFPSQTEIGGTVEVAGHGSGFWTAKRYGANAFLFRSHLPSGVMSHSKQDKRGMGWLWEIPACIRDVDDPVMQKRILAGMESCLYRIVDPSVTLILPYKFEVTNVFSKKNPMWPYPLPLVDG